MIRRKQNAKDEENKSEKNTEDGSGLRRAALAQKRMSRELEEYRFVMEDLVATYGNKTWIRLTDLARAEGCDPRTAAKRYGIPKGAGGIDRSVLARRKCRLAK